MGIAYECPCDDILRFFIEEVLKEIDDKFKEVYVFDADQRRIYMRVKVWNEDGEPSIIGMVKGNWEDRMWVLKYEFDIQNEFKATLQYVLYDMRPSQTKEYKLSSTKTFFHMIPTLIENGCYSVERKDDTIEFCRIIFTNE